MWLQRLLNFLIPVEGLIHSEKAIILTFFVLGAIAIAIVRRLY